MKLQGQTELPQFLSRMKEGRKALCVGVWFALREITKSICKIKH